MNNYKLVLKDAFWQIVGRIVSALAGFFVISWVAPYFGALRYGDYETILAYFAFASSLSDLWLYVLGLKEMWQALKKHTDKNKINYIYSQIVRSRWFLIIVVYTFALLIAYFLPAYTSNQFLIRGLPLGMMFSATFMWAGILQLPLQVSRKMEQVSFSLIFARIVQIIFLALIIFVFFPKNNFTDWNITIEVFIAVLSSLFISALAQFIYTYITWKKYFKLKKVPFFKFTIKTVKHNWKYWVGFFLSSAPMLAVTIILSIIYPTAQWFVYAGTWALAIKIITLLLVIPPAIWNSLLHKVSWMELSKQKKTFQTFLTIGFWIGCIILLNAILFSPWLIQTIWWTHYLSTASNILLSIQTFINSWTWIGSDIVFVFLSWVLVINFIKQVLNYYLVATWRQNDLFWVNLIGMVVWFTFWWFAIVEWSLIWWLITQFLFEILFVVGLWIMIRKRKLQFKIQRWNILKMLFFMFFVIWWWFYFDLFAKIDNTKYFFISAILLNLLIVWLWFKTFVKTAKELVGK